jgi:predicted nucleotidyltransferase component of viral defense system
MSNKIQEHPYFKQASLMLEALPAVAEEECFALKGGTAINFFVRNMPRLSVDIDLTYLPIEDRPTSLTKVGEALKRISLRIQKDIPRTKIQEGLVRNTKIVSKLYITSDETQVIIEPNLTLRGTVFGTKVARVCPQVAKDFASSVSIAIVSNADLYGGKICAALDRQHPRDLYDVKILLENEGLTDEIRKGFIVYLCGHDETMSQLLSPPRKDIQDIYEKQFVGMTIKPIPLDELVQTREKIIGLINSSLNQKEREFLISLKKGEPQWDLLAIPGVEKLPAIQWKLANIKKMKSDHHLKSVERLKATPRSG